MGKGVSGKRRLRLYFHHAKEHLSTWSYCFLTLKTIVRSQSAVFILHCPVGKVIVVEIRMIKMQIIVLKFALFDLHFYDQFVN